MLFKSVSLSVFATLVIMVPLASVGQSNADAFSDVSLRAENEIQQGHLEAGMAMLKAAADAGDASAEYGLAFHLNGNGETTHYMISSASHGFALARVALGWQYEAGYDLPQNFRIALGYFNVLDSQGVSAGHHGVVRVKAELGRWGEISAGEDEENADDATKAQDYARALPLYLKAAASGSASAAFNLGMFYERGTGVKRSNDEAMRWFLKAAKQDYLPAQVWLAEGDYVFGKDSFAWLKRAADAGSPRAQYWVAEALNLGKRGQVKDQRASLAMLRRAAAQEDPLAKVWLSGLYCEGKTEEGIKDPDKAITLLKEAIQDGDIRASLLLGFYRLGCGK